MQFTLKKTKKLCAFYIQVTQFSKIQKTNIMQEQDINCACNKVNPHPQAKTIRLNMLYSGNHIIENRKLKKNKITSIKFI